MSFGVGPLLGRTFGLHVREPRIVALSLAAALPIALTFYVHFALLSDAERTGTMRGLTLLTMAALYLALQPVERGAAAFLVARRLEGEEAGLRAAVRAGLQGYPRVVGVQLVLVAALAAGAAVLLLPALVMAAGWCAAAPAAVLERLGPLAALRRSWGLSRGYRWGLLAGIAVAYAIVGVGLLAVVITIGVLLPPSGDTTPQFDGLCMGALVVVPGVLSSFPRVASAVAYHGLRAVKEGNESLASVFA